MGIKNKTTAIRDRFRFLVEGGDYEAIVDELDVFIKVKVDFNLRTPSEGSKRKNNGATFLEWLNYNNFLPEMIKVLEAGADPNLKNLRGATLLGNCSASSPQTVELLLLHGADPNLPGREGMTPLQIAISNLAEVGAPLCVKHLLAHGADPELVGGRWGGFGKNNPASPLRMAQALELWGKENAEPEYAKEMGQAIVMMKAKIEEKALDDELTAKTDAGKRNKGI